MASKLPLQPPPRTESELIDQVGIWANYNFGHLRGPDYGLVEEIGEAAHAVLKYRQKIRGFTEGKFYEVFVDSLADAIIYLADYCYIHRTFFRFKRNMQQPQAEMHDERQVITHLLQAVSQLFRYEEVTVGDIVEVGQQEIYNVIVQRICNGLEYWASIYDIDLLFAVNVTWDKVKRRDWRKNRAQGNPFECGGFVKDVED